MLWTSIECNYSEWCVCLNEECESSTRSYTQKLSIQFLEKENPLLSFAIKFVPTFIYSRSCIKVFRVCHCIEKQYVTIKTFKYTHRLKNTK